MPRKALESFQQVHSAVTGTANSSTIDVNGKTLGHVQVDDAGSGTFTVTLVGQVHEDAEEQALYSESGAGAKGATITAEGLYVVNVAGLSRMKANITANSGGTAISVYVGFNS